MVSKDGTGEENIAVKRILEFVYKMKDDQLIEPMPRSALIEKLNIENPYVIDTVEVWLHVRR